MDYELRNKLHFRFRFVCYVYLFIIILLMEKRFELIFGLGTSTSTKLTFGKGISRLCLSLNSYITTQIIMDTQLIQEPVIKLTTTSIKKVS